MYAKDISTVILIPTQKEHLILFQKGGDFY